jgi:DNA-binding NarL/FixJ family response regulator
MHILILDDHPMVLSGLAATLRARGHRIDTARDAASALALIAQTPPNLALFDYHLAESNVEQLLANPAVRTIATIVILSGMTDPEDILGALEEGAHAFIPKSIEPDDLGTALEILADTAARPLIWKTEAGQFIPVENAFPKATTLTHKEREVFRHLRRGLLDKQIADQLGLSIHTVRVHLRAIKRKRGSSRRAEQEQ